MATYLHDSRDERAAIDLKVRLPRRMNHVAVAPDGTDQRSTRFAVRALTHTDILVVPDELERCTPQMEKLKMIAHLLDLKVMPVLHYLDHLARTQRSHPVLNGHPA